MTRRCMYTVWGSRGLTLIDLGNRQHPLCSYLLCIP